MVLSSGETSSGVTSGGGSALKTTPLTPWGLGRAWRLRLWVTLHVRHNPRGLLYAISSGDVTYPALAIRAVAQTTYKALMETLKSKGSAERGEQRVLFMVGLPRTKSQIKDG